jgi:hypothetical protein
MQAFDVEITIQKDLVDKWQHIFRAYSELGLIPARNERTSFR